MYRRILVPLDGSARAESILKHVEGLAAGGNTTVIFMQVVQDTVVSDGYKSIQFQQSKEISEKKAAEAESYLSAIAGVFREKGIKTRKIVENGSVVAAILRVAQREAADLIAMASHGRGGLSRVFYGSVAAGILQAIDRPLLLIRSRQA